MSKEETKPANADGVLYELGFHFVPTIAEDKLEEEFKAVEDKIASIGGDIKKSSKPALVRLAYTIVKNVDSKNYKYDTAYFAWVKFVAAGEDVVKLGGELDLNSSILRHMIVKTTLDADISSEDVALVVNGKEDLESSDDSDSDDKEGDDSDVSDEETEDEDAKEDASDDDSKKESKESKKSIDDVDKAIDDMVA